MEIDTTLEAILTTITGYVTDILPSIATAAGVGAAVFVLFMGIRWLIKAVRAVK